MRKALNGVESLTDEEGARVYAFFASEYDNENKVK